VLEGLEEAGLHRGDGMKPQTIVARLKALANAARANAEKEPEGCIEENLWYCAAGYIDDAAEAIQDCIGDPA
jgi:hypothetical protein